jgi:pimeloyl-ACP methyl ester carboxylesterase
MHLKTEDGVRLHVAELGQGAPVVMLHGLVIGSMMTWYLHIAPRLARHHRVVMFDLRGHGKSDRPVSGYDLDTLSRDLDCVVQQLGLGAAVMVGHSYGALVALRFASLRPDSVSKLVLVEAPIAHAPATDGEAFLGLHPEKMLEALPPDLRGAISSGRRRTRFLEAMRFFATESSTVQDMQVAVTEAGRYLSTVRCPVLAVYGTESACRPSVAQISAEIPQSTIVELPGGHFLPIEMPDQLGKVLEAFIDG